jgi:single stranded DNA-binding protein (ssb)
MSEGLNKTQIIVYLGRDPESNTPQGGLAVTRCSVGVTERWRDRDDNEKEHTESYRVVAFDRVGGVCPKFLGKGRLRITSYTDRNDQTQTSTELLATCVIVLNAPCIAYEAGEPRSRPSTAQTEAETDDVPFQTGSRMTSSATPGRAVVDVSFECCRGQARLFEVPH